MEILGLGIAVAIAWWLRSHATTGWLERVHKLGLQAPSEDVVRGLAHQATIYFSVGVLVLIIARVIAARRAQSAIDVPWLLPAAVVASLFGFAVQLASIEVSRGTALAPTALGFAQGFLFGCIAAAVILVVPVDLAELASRARKPIAIAIALIFAALAVFGSGPAGSGTRINLGPMQPIELIKPLAIAFLAAYFGARAPKLRWQRQRFLRLRWPRVELLVPAILALLAIVAGLYVIGDLGPVLLLALVFLGMFFVASRATGWVVVALAIIVAVLLVLGAWPELAGGGTVKTRLVMWHDPWNNGMTNGAQLGEGLWAISAGGWTGQGLGNAATPLVPAGKTDLVLATMGEQVGAFGLVVYQAALAALVLGALYVAARSRTAERVLIASGIAILLLAQWLVILGGTLGLLPLTGIVVPFVSSGRSSMAVFIAMIALVARLANDGRVRVASTELEELHGAVGGVRTVALVAMAFAILASVAAAATRRAHVSSRGILTKLRDGTLITRYNPRLVVLAERLRRGSILDRNGEPLAHSPTATTRKYPLGNALGTLLGVSPTKVLLPSWALERQLDDRLKGYADLGSLVPLIDLDDAAREREIAKRDADTMARSVKITLDAKLQAKVAELARAAVSKRSITAAAAVVLDVDTGQVIARVQVPDYDPNKPTWQDKVLANDETYLRRFRGAYGEWPDKTGIQGMFQSGSVGKLFTALAAVRAGNSGSRYDCKEEDEQGPFFTLKGWHKPIHDHEKDRPHGAPDLVEALSVSCNVYFAQLGLALGPDPFASLRSAGLDVGYSSKLDPGKPGTRQLASTAYGQGAMVMSAMQAARMTAAVASGGHYKRCGLELAGKCTETSLVTDPALLHPIVSGMRRVMTKGTGARLVQPPGMRIYGKTGTADVRGFAGEEPFGIARRQVAAPHSWFVAFAEPEAVPELAVTGKGRIVVAVVIPRGGTGASAAGPLAMQIFSAAQSLGYLQ